MQSQEIKLFGYDLLITERKAFDIYEFDNYKKGIKDELGILFGDALFVTAGLKYNYDRLLCKIFLFGNEIKFPIRLFRYFKLKKILSADYLFKNLPRSEINSLIQKIWFLETGEDLTKKKVLRETDKESAENLQQL